MERISLPGLVRLIVPNGLTVAAVEAQRTIAARMKPVIEAMRQANERLRLK